MDYFRWLIKNAFGRDPALFLPCLAITAIVVAFSYAIHIVAGAILTVIAVAFWGTVSYTFLSDIFRSSYERYQQEKKRESKTP